jgi:hypothetical protein
MHLVFSRACVALIVAPYTAVQQADRRSDPLSRRTCAVETPPYHGGIFVVSTPSPPSTYLISPPFLVRAVQSRPTIAVPPVMDAATVEH